MKRPTHTFPNSPGFISPGTPKNLPDPQLAPEQFEQLIKNRGLRWQHFKASPCPNVVDLETSMHDPNCRNCENGMLFYGGTIIHGVFQNNKLERVYEVNGLWDIGSAVVTFSAYADDAQGNAGQGLAVDLQHFDKLIMLDYQDRFQELIEHTPLGIDRLRYPALSVEFVSTKSKRYYIDQHFVIDANGYIQWLNNDQPSYDQLNSKGEIYTIAYTMRPTYYCVQLVHETRATKAMNPATGLITAVRLPQQVLLRRDFLFTHPSDKNGLPTQGSPASGGNVNTPD